MISSHGSPTGLGRSGRRGRAGQAAEPNMQLAETAGPLLPYYAGAQRDPVDADHDPAGHLPDRDQLHVLGSFAARLAGFIDVQNYVRIFTKDDRFWNSVMVQLKLSLMTVPAQVLLGLALAVFLKERFKNAWLVEVARSTLLVPMVIPPIVAALIWKIIFTPPVSIFSYVSTELGFGPLDWLGHPDLALVAIAIAGIWEFFPFSFLLLYAGLLSLPEEPYEAALVDGATRWQTFRHVTLPMLMPTLSIVLLFRIIDSIRAFPLIYVMTQGGPGFATEPTNFYAYTQAFSYTYIGYSSAMIVVVLAFTMVLTGFALNRITWHRGAVS